MNTAAKPRIEVVRVTDAIAEELAVFFRAAWGDDGNADAVRNARAKAARENPVEPGADIPATAYIHDGSVFGYLGTIPVQFWNGNRDVPGYWLKGFMVLPEHRGGPVGFAVLKEMLKHVNVSGIMTVAAPARRLFTAVGYTDCGVLPNYVTFLRPERVARQIDVAAVGLGLPKWVDQSARIAQQTGLAWLGGLVAGGAMRIWRDLHGGSGGFSISSGSLPDSAEVNTLWSDARPSIVAAAVRDWRMLNWRYAPVAGGPYECVTVRDARGKLAALSIVRRPRGESDPRLRGIRMATISDVLFTPGTPAGLAAFAGAERVARDMDADAMLCSTTHPAITGLLAGRAYVRLPGNVHLMIRDPKGAGGLSTKVDEWWVMRGDAGSDEVF